MLSSYIFATFTSYRFPYVVGNCFKPSGHACSCGQACVILTLTTIPILVVHNEEGAGTGLSCALAVICCPLAAILVGMCRSRCAWISIYTCRCSKISVDVHGCSLVLFTEYYCVQWSCMSIVVHWFLWASIDVQWFLFVSVFLYLLVFIILTDFLDDYRCSLMFDFHNLFMSINFHSRYRLDSLGFKWLALI